MSCTVSYAQRFFNRCVNVFCYSANLFGMLVFHETARVALFPAQVLKLTSRSTTAFTNTKCCFCVRTGQVTCGVKS